MLRNRSRRGIFFVVLAIVASGVLGTIAAQPEPKTAEQLDKLVKDGNFAEAYEGYRQRLLDPEIEHRLIAGGDIRHAMQCLARLRRYSEADQLLEGCVEAHGDSWQVLQRVAQQYFRVLPHNGFTIAGKYERGSRRGGGKWTSSEQRDRVRALQLMQQAMELADNDDDKSAVAMFYLELAAQLIGQRGYGEAWRLQYLTDTSKLPDYDESNSRYGSTRGAPVNDDDSPVFYSEPKTWQDATSDGERWRWTLSQAAENSSGYRDNALKARAEFLYQQFGVQTMQHYGLFRGARDEQSDDQTGTYALHTLGESETLCRLATGARRIELPDEHNFIKIYQRLASEQNASRGTAKSALQRLATIFENRRQYETAAKYWRESIERFGADNQKWKQKQLNQIVSNWGRFEPVTGQGAGTGATIEYRFRNGKGVKFVAQRIKVDLLLSDIKAYLKSGPSQLDGNKLQLGDLGYRLVQQNDKKYVGETTASWSLKLDPREKHFDRRITVTTPLQKAGAYLLTANMVGGNVSKVIMWVSDTAIVRKQLSGKNLYYIADAVSGKPIAGANVEFFGYRVDAVKSQQTRRPARTRQIKVTTANFAERSNSDGLVTPDPRDLKQDHYQWLVMARTSRGRLAYLGFQNIWTGRYQEAEYNQAKVFNITDRPVYRPGQQVHYKFWVRRPKYDQKDVSEFAGRSLVVEVRSPKGEKLFAKTVRADEFGGVEGDWEIPDGATLGQYRLQLLYRDLRDNVASGGGTFRVEEYKKPEFEVTVEAPDKPVMLGEKITARIEAKYFFGAPVTNATVKYKITRTTHNDRWYPIRPWDWLYGPGYWWYAPDYSWYRGYSKWIGCVRPPHGYFGFPRGGQPPELVAEREVKIGSSGVVEVEIDTQLAKALHGNEDHKYTITAEVRDASRRTIVGSGNVLVARKPFKVFTWVDRGFYRVGDTVTAQFHAQTLANVAVKGKGTLNLLRVGYNSKGEPHESVVQSWKIDTDAKGGAAQKFVASEKGQYRLSFALTDSEGHKIEGGYLFNVIGDGFDGREFRFNQIELIADRSEYRPGEKVELQINAERAGSTVLLFVRPANGVYLPPKVVRLTGKSTTVKIDVKQRDMPNFFVEAVTVAGGGVHTAVRNIVVPPEKRLLNLAVLPSAETYRPGEKANIRLKLTDEHGKPFVGSTVVSIYDKAVEYISGGSNVQDIRTFFWKWQRNHQPDQQTNLGRYSQNMTLPKADRMNDVGAFGGSQIEDLDGLAVNGIQTRTSSRGRGGFLGGGMLEMADAAPMMLAKGAAPGVTGRPASESGVPPDLVAPTVRSEFADTALWRGSVTTDGDGFAELTLDMPDNLTTWMVKAWAMGHGSRVAASEAEVITRKDLIVRLQAPRFFVEKDEVVLSANVHNYLKTEKRARVELDLPAGLLVAMGPTSKEVTIAAGGEARVDWRVRVTGEGEALVRMKGLTDEESDAVEMRFPCYIHGILKTDSWAGTLRPDQNKTAVTINVPSQRRLEQSVLEVRYSPTLAGAMVDALPYLVDYPYGCTEQTLNRFVPTVITQKVLLDMRLNLDEIRKKRTNLNAQEIGDDIKRAAQWKRYERNPVFSEAEVRRMVKDGVKRLTEMQNSDGGWGWFSGYGEHSYPHTTAVVVHGLQIAQQNDVAIVPDVLQKGIAWLERYQTEQVRRLNNAPKKVRPWKTRADNLDALVFMVLTDADIKSVPMNNFLYRDRVDLAVYAKALYGLALEKLGSKVRLTMIMRNIRQFEVHDEENETAYLRTAGGSWWYWYGSEVEANAYYLKLLARTDPNGKTAPRLVKYLLNNRKHGSRWKSTRDTALCVEAMVDYLKATDELSPNLTVEVWIDGVKRKEVAINRENLFSFDNRLVLQGAAVASGEHKVELRRRGKGPVYFNVYLTNFTLEDDIRAAGLEIKVNRKYYKLEPIEKTIKVAGSRGQVADQRVEKYRRVQLNNLDTIISGDLVEIELELDSKNDYEYLMFEDMKAAGFEPVDLRSGYGNNSIGAYMELRDERVTFFMRSLLRGKHSVSYRMRAETPGRFSALPTRASAMYAPELRANSDEMKINIVDQVAEKD